MPIADANGISIHYELSGTGQPDGSNRLLCISGTGGDLREQPSMSDAFADTFEVLAYDQRGLGQTEVPEGPYTMAEYADDAAALIAAVGWDDCAVVGISFGGMVAQELAIRHPGRVRRLALCCTSSGGAGGASYPLHELADRGQDPPTAPPSTSSSWTSAGTSAWRAANPDMAAMIIERFASSAANARSRPAPPARGTQPPRHGGPPRHHRLPHPRRRWPLRRHRPAGQQRVPGPRHPRCALRLFDGGHGFFMQDPEAIPAIVDFLAAANP